MKRHIAAVVTLGVLGLVAAGCDSSPASVALGVSASPFTAGGMFSPLPIGFNSLVVLNCPGGFAFGTSLFLNVTAGSRNLTLDHVTLHLINGSNIGGPAITVPRTDLTGRSGTTVILAGSTRQFVLTPTFDCVLVRPQSLVGTLFLFDQMGAPQTMTVEGTIQ